MYSLGVYTFGLAGDVDDFRICNRALGAAEVQSLFRNPGA
jgi:hypothetical protein